MRRFVFTQVDSTSTRAAELAATHPGEVLLITAITQTAGRGRTGRPWASPPGGAWFTLVWPTAHAPDTYDPAPLVAGLAVCEAIAHIEYRMSHERPCPTPTPIPDAQASASPSDIRHSISDLLLKWPNDILLGGKKVAGILCERWQTGRETTSPLPSGGGREGGRSDEAARATSTPKPSTLGPSAPAALFIGVGINANFDPALLPADLRYPATTLRHELGRDIDLEALLHACATRLVEHLERLQPSGLDPDILARINARLAFRGQPLTVRTLTGAHTGLCRGIDSRGALRLETTTGPVSLTTGEVAQVSRSRVSDAPPPPESADV